MFAFNRHGLNLVIACNCHCHNLKLGSLGHQGDHSSLLKVFGQTFFSSFLLPTGRGPSSAKLVYTKLCHNHSVWYANNYI